MRKVLQLLTTVLLCCVDSETRLDLIEDMEYLAATRYRPMGKSDLQIDLILFSQTLHFLVASSPARLWIAFRKPKKKNVLLIKLAKEPSRVALLIVGIALPSKAGDDCIENIVDLYHDRWLKASGPRWPQISVWKEAIVCIVGFYWNLVMKKVSNLKKSFW